MNSHNALGRLPLHQKESMSNKAKFVTLLSVGIITLALLNVATSGLNSKDVLSLVVSTVVLCFMLRRNNETPRP